MNLGIVERLTMTEYKNITDNAQNIPAAPQVSSSEKGCCGLDQNNEYSRD